MSQEIAQLQEKRQKLYAEIKAKADEFEKNGRSWKDGEQANWEKLNADYDAVGTQLEEHRKKAAVADRMAAIEADLRQSSAGQRFGREDAGRLPQDRRPGEDGAEAVTEQTRSIAFRAACKQMAGLDVNKRERQAMKVCRYKGKRLLLPTSDMSTYEQLRSAALNGNHHNRMKALQKESRALDAVTLASGGVLVPTSLVRAIEVNMLYHGTMLLTSETIITSDGGEFTWPSADDTSNEGAIVGQSTDASTTTADPSFGGLRLYAHKFTSRVIKVPEELLEDSAIDLPSMLGAIIGERLGRGANRKYTTGTGASEPTGIVNSAGLGATISGTTITYDKIVELEHSVDVAYRSAPSCGYMMNDKIVQVVRLLRDSDNSLIYKGGKQADRPDEFNTFPIFINNHMVNATTAGNKVMLFGALAKYKIRRVRGVRFYRMDERYRDSDQTGFVGFSREDGGLLNAGTSPVNYLVTS
jgi:HK97 family phage major capsid protein